MKTKLGIQNEKGSMLIFIILTIFITMLLAAGILTSQNTQSQQTDSVMKKMMQKQDFANFINTVFSNSATCSGLQLYEATSTGSGTFTIVNPSALPTPTVVLGPGTIYPDPLTAPFFTVCADATAPCPAVTPPAGPGMNFVYDSSPPGFVQSDFTVTYKYYDPALSFITTQNIITSVQYVVASGGPGLYTASSCSVVTSNITACTNLGLTWCPAQLRCPVCEATGGCWNALSSVCSFDAGPCALPTPGVGSPPC